MDIIDSIFTDIDFLIEIFAKFITFFDEVMKSLLRVSIPVNPVMNLQSKNV